MTLANGYDAMGTWHWLCIRPECVIAFKLTGEEYEEIVPVHRTEPSTARCYICNRKLAGGLKVEV